MKYMSQFLEYFPTKPVFSAQEVKRFLYYRGSRNNYYKLLLFELLENKKIYRIKKGYYTFHQDVELAGYAFYPYYYGLEEALSLLKIWGQKTNPVIITPRHVRTGIREFEGRNYIVRKIERKMFFGFDLVKYYDFYIFVSDPAKTLIDFYYYNETLPEEVLISLIKKVNKKVLKTYLMKIDKKLKNKILNDLRKEKNIKI